MLPTASLRKITEFLDSMDAMQRQVYDTLHGIELNATQIQGFIRDFDSAFDVVRSIEALDIAGGAADLADFEPVSIAREYLESQHTFLGGVVHSGQLLQDHFASLQSVVSAADGPPDDFQEVLSQTVLPDPIDLNNFASTVLDSVLSHPVKATPAEGESYQELSGIQNIRVVISGSDTFTPAQPSSDQSVIVLTTKQWIGLFTVFILIEIALLQHLWRGTIAAYRLELVLQIAQILITGLPIYLDIVQKDSDKP